MLRGLIDKLTRRAASPDAVSWRAVSDRAATMGDPEQLSAVLACVDVISAAIASLPASVRDRNGRVVDDHPVAGLIDQGPNPWQTWQDFIQWYMGQVLLYGNAVAEVRRDGEIWPIPWSHVSVYQLSSGRLRYDFTRFPWGNVYPLDTGNARGQVVAKLLPEEVLHLRDRTDDGLVGRSRLERASDPVQHGKLLQAAAGSLWRNGVFPSGALTVPGRMSADTRNRLRADIETEFAGANQRSKLMVLDQGATFSQASMNPEDAEVLDSRRFSVEEMCRLYNVPPPIIQEYSHNTFTNSEAAGRWFAQFTLAGWIRKLEAVFRRGLLEDGLGFEFDMSAFLRGDHESRWNAYKIAIETGVLSKEEIRAMESMGT